MAKDGQSSGSSHSSKDLYSSFGKRHNGSLWSTSNEESAGEKLSGRLHSPQHSNMRLNPMRVKEMGFKMVKDEGSASNSVVAWSDGAHGGLSPMNDSDMNLKMRSESMNIEKSKSKRVFSEILTLPGFGFCCGNTNHLFLSRENHKIPPSKRVKWWQVTLFLLNDINEAWLMLFSVIVLGMNGWILGMLILVGLWPVNMYTAQLLWRCRNVFPGAISMGDLVYYLSHSCWAMYIAFIVVNFTIALNFAFNIIVAGGNVYWLTGLTSGKCSVIFLVGICLILLPLSQLRTLYSLTIINMINLICMFCFAAIYMYFLARDGPDAGAVTRIGPHVESWQNFFIVGEDVKAGPFVGIDIIISAYHYQLLILEIMAEMKDPREFPKAHYSCTPFVLLLTLSCAAFRYYFQGEQTDLGLIMPHDIIASAFDQSKSVLAYFGMVCFTIKMLGSCLIRSVILIRFMQLLIHPQSANVRTWRSRLEWAGISVFVLAFVCMLSIASFVVLYLNTILAILTLLLAIVLPVVLYVTCKSLVGQVKQIPWYEWLLMSIIVSVSFGIIILTLFKFGVNGSDLLEQQNNFTRASFQLMTDCRFR